MLFGKLVLQEYDWSAAANEEGQLEYASDKLYAYLGAVPTRKLIPTYAGTTAVTDGELVTTNASGELTSSGYSIDDAGTGTTDLWSASQIIDYAGKGLDWQDSVADKDLTSPPGSPSVGDRYIVGGSATGAWATLDNDIVEWDGSAWDVRFDSSAGTSEGGAVWVEDEDTIYAFDGTSWNRIGNWTSPDFDDLNDVNVTGATQGSILYKGATNWEDLAAGSTNEVLITGATPSWGLIANANIDASAAIAWTKLATGTANRVLVTNGSGVITEVAAPSTNQVLQWSGSAYQWTDMSAGSLSGLSDTDITTPDAGSLLVYDGTDSWDDFDLGAANTVLRVNSGATTVEYGLLTNANIAAAGTADIDVGKLEDVTAEELATASISADGVAYGIIGSTSNRADVTKLRYVDYVTGGAVRTITAASHGLGAQLLDYRIWRTTDSGSTWKVVDTSVTVNASFDVAFDLSMFSGSENFALILYRV